MITRFQGTDGHHSLIDCLLRQTLVCNDRTIAEELADIGELIQLEANSPGSEFISERGYDNDLYLILAGHVSVKVKGREIATRFAGTHVGDMAMIEPSAPRSASVIARETTVLLKIAETSFANLANKHPVLWRRLAIELAERLRQRGNLIHEPNPHPVVFIGSSLESLAVAKALKADIKGPGVSTRLWKDRGVFRPSQTTIEAIAAAADGSDFAVLVLGPEDLTTSRGKRKLAPRDNVILELGWFMGAIGRERTYAIKPQSADLKLPSDLLGLTLLNYDSSKSDLRRALHDACADIRDCIAKLGVK